VLTNVRGLAIIGGGTAGLSAGLYAARHRADAVLFERLGLGGQLINVDRVENFIGFPEPISGYELGPKMADHAMSSGLQIDTREIVSLAQQGDIWRLDLGEGEEPVLAQAVIVATGSQLARLGVPGEEEFAGMGVSYCATCDGEFFRGKPVAVVGGGDSALDEALYLAEIAERVTVIHRDQALGGTPSTRERLLEQANVQVVANRVVTEITGDDLVNGVRLAQPDGGPADPLEVAGVFIYVGLKPQTGLLRGLAELDALDHVAVDQNMATSRPGLFAAGDIRQHSARQLATAAGDGVTAALAACEYLRRAERVAGGVMS
jgi:thioredoxin reductase (NADPH)